MPDPADHEQQPLAELSGSRFTPLARNSLSQRAYEEIRAYLMRGRLKPGERLVSRLLASELGISTTPVREALARLASEKALELDHRNTVVVPTLTAERYEEIRDLRAQLEGLAAMRAAGVATTADVGELVALHEGHLASESKGALESALAYNEQFHFKLCRLCELPLLMTIVEMLWLQCGPLLNHFYSGNVSLWTHAKHPHLDVIRSLERRDGEGARAAIVLDITEGAKPILAKLRSRQSQ
jgi:DNA-binding GntR family transcriptional regulator